MLAARARARLVFPSAAVVRPSMTARRFFADQPSTTPSASTPPPPPPPPSAAPVSAAPSVAPTSQAKTEYNDVIPIPKQRAPRKLQDGYSGTFYLSLLGGLLITAPIITYFYWEHRKAHMRSKKEAILKDIQARHGVA